LRHYPESIIGYGKQFGKPRQSCERVLLNKHIADD
jgi:hypothetical protein